MVTANNCGAADTVSGNPSLGDMAPTGKNKPKNTPAGPSTKHQSSISTLINSCNAKDGSRTTPGKQPGQPIGRDAVATGSESDPDPAPGCGADLDREIGRPGLRSAAAAAAAGPPSPPGGAPGGETGGGAGPVNAELAELIRSVVRSELGRATAALQSSLREAVTALSDRIGELEGRLFEKDEQIERLTSELKKSNETVEELQDTVDVFENEMRQPTLVISGPAVPAPSRGGGTDGVVGADGARGTGGSRVPEDAVSLVVAVIKKAMPNVSVCGDDVASCFRVGSSRKLVCRFLRSGPGSVRDAVYQGRFELMRQSDESKQLFVSESLTRRRQQFLSVLLEAKKKKRVYTVFTKNGTVHYKERKDGPAVRVDGLHSIRRFV